MFIVTYLNSDEELKGLLQGPRRITPCFTTDISKPSLVYNMYLSRGGAIKQSTLEIKVIWSNYDEVKEIETVLGELLHMDNNDSAVCVDDTYFHSQLSGGGILFRDDLQMYENTMYFIVKHDK